MADERGRLVRIDGVELCRVPGLGHASEMDDDAGIFRELFQRGCIGEVSR
jgi:hypothetical protein